MAVKLRAGPIVEPQRGDEPFAVTRARLSAVSLRLHYLKMTPLQALGEAVRERLEAKSEHRRLVQLREGSDVCWAASDEAEPLVTVRIATYNRAALVVDRAIASALRQSYERLEILVIGDHCDEATERAVRSVTDPRVKFINLAEHGLYPADTMRRWMAAGSIPMNAGLAIAQGKWITPCDDDDEMTDDHVEVLLRDARQRRLEFVWSKAAFEVGPGNWVDVGKSPLVGGGISHGSVLYASGLRIFRYNENCWKLAEPLDWNLFRRMRAAGVKMDFLDELTYRHYL
jgi:Glycosyl transferase family 2